MSDPPLSDIDFKNKMVWVWTTFKADQFGSDDRPLFNLGRLRERCIREALFGPRSFEFLAVEYIFH